MPITQEAAPSLQKSGEYQREAESALRYSAAISKIGDMALAWVQANEGAYREWYLKRYGKEPPNDPKRNHPA